MLKAQGKVASSRRGGERALLQRYDEIVLHEMCAAGDWRAHHPARGLRRTGRHGDRPDTQPDVASAFFVAVAVTVTGALAIAKRPDVLDRRDRPAFDIAGSQRPLFVCGLDSRQLRMDRENGRLVGGHRTRFGAG